VWDRPGFCMFRRGWRFIVTSRSVPGSLGTGTGNCGYWIVRWGAFGHFLYADGITAQLLMGKSEVLWVSVNREVTNCCFDRLIRLRVESAVVEVVLREVGQNGLAVGHAVGNDANPGSGGPK
jgi:hypothetical protein